MTEKQFCELLQQNGTNAVMPALQKIAEIVVEVYTKGCKDGIEYHNRILNEGVDEWCQEAISTMLQEAIDKLRK